MLGLDELGTDDDLLGLDGGGLIFTSSQQSSTAPVASSHQGLGHVLSLVRSSAPVATLIRVAVHPLALLATSAPVAAITHFARKVLLSAAPFTNPQAAIVKSVARSVVASTSPVGLVFRQWVRSYLASSSPVGSVVRAIAKVVGKRSNLVPYSGAGGGTNGVIFGGTITGALPTNWSVVSAQTGLVFTVVDHGTITAPDGATFPYVTINISGTPTNSGFNGIGWATGQPIVYTTGVKYTLSLYVGVVSGSRSGIENLSANFGIGQAVSFTATSTLTRYSGQGTATSGGNSFNTEYGINCSVGVPVNYTVMLGGPQVETPELTPFMGNPANSLLVYWPSPLGPVASMTHAVTKPLAASATQVSTILYQMARALAATTSPTATAKKQWAHAFSAAASAVAGLVRSTSVRVGAVMNMALQSNALQTTPWAAVNGAVVTGNSATAPDGTTTAALIDVTASLGTFAGLAQPIVSQNGVTNTWGLWLMATGSNIGKTVHLDYSNASGNSQVTLTGTWTRYPVTGVAAGNIQIRLLSYPGDTATQFLGWGAQCQKGSALTGLIVTTTAAITVWGSSAAAIASLVRAAVVPLTGSTSPVGSLLYSAAKIVSAAAGAAGLLVRSTAKKLAGSTAPVASRKAASTKTVGVASTAPVAFVYRGWIRTLSAATSPIATAARVFAAGFREAAAIISRSIKSW